MMESDIDWQLSKKSIAERFSELYKLSKWTDCTFSVGETDAEVIKCHKLVLAASSPVFEALFYGPCSAFNKEVIHITDLEPRTFNLLLQYLYCGSTKISDIIDAGMLLYASKKYLLPHLSRICIEYISHHIQLFNIHEVLEIAETLNEDELLDTCLKVLRQYSVDIWSSAIEHLSRNMLSRLLDEDASNSSEFELWNFVVSWAEDECKLKGFTPDPENLRRVLDEIGLLQRIRFLTFSKNQLMDFVKSTHIISDSEFAALVECLNVIETGSKLSEPCVDSDDRSASSDGGCCEIVVSDKEDKCVVVLPKGFNSNSTKRIRVSSYINHCPRSLVTKQKTWTYGGTVCTKITSQTHVMVTGFEVATRIPSNADFCMSHGKTGHYNERLVVRICDDSGAVLSRTDYSGVAEFNASQNVKLLQPVWFHPQRKYSVMFELPDGQYPLCQLSETASCKVTYFLFEDATNYQDRYMKYSFIMAVMFSL